MKLCLICSDISGGFGSFVKNIVLILQKNKNQVDILSLSKKYNLDINVTIQKLTITENVNKKDYRKLNRFNIQYFFLKIINKLFPRLINKRYDNLFMSQLSKFYLVKKHHQSYDLSNYDCVISAEEILCNYFLANNVIAKRKIGFIHPDYKEAHFSKMIDKPMLKKLDCICTVSQASALTLKKCIPSIKNKVYGIRNAIDIENVLSLSRENIDEAFDDDLINIITVCRLDNTSKALDRLLDLAKHLRNKNYRFVWRIVGDGKYADTMEKYIKGNHLDNEIKMLGHKNNPIPYVKASDLFVLQSYYEGYPISVCEALIVNTPCLITNFPAANELILNPNYGFIAENNFASIVKKLEQAINDIKKLRKMQFNLEKYNKDYFSDINDFLKICKG